MNKNLLYLIPAAIVGGVVAYITNKQNQKAIEESKRIVEETTKSIFDCEDLLNASREELEKSIDDFCKTVKEREEIQERTNRINKENAEVQSRLKDYIKKEAE